MARPVGLGVVSRRRPAPSPSPRGPERAARDREGDPPGMRLDTATTPRPSSRSRSTRSPRRSSSRWPRVPRHPGVLKSSARRSSRGRHPVSIVGALAVAYFAGFTITSHTPRVVLAIGLVVDDAIVVLENAYRHMEMESAPRAALDGSKEIGFAILATTIALVACSFGSFLQGPWGALQRVGSRWRGRASPGSSPSPSRRCSARACSGRCTREGNWAQRSFDAFFDWLNGFYDRLLRGTMHHRSGSPWSRSCSSSSRGELLLPPRELVPRRTARSASASSSPRGATLEYTDRYMRQWSRSSSSCPSGGALLAVGLGFGGRAR